METKTEQPNPARTAMLTLGMVALMPLIIGFYKATESTKSAYVFLVPLAAVFIFLSRRIALAGYGPVGPALMAITAIIMHFSI